MTAIFAAWVVAILIGVTAEAGGRRGAAAVSAVGFVSVSAIFVALAFVSPLSWAAAMAQSPEAGEVYQLLNDPAASAFAAGLLMLAVFGPFVLIIPRAAPSLPLPAAETWRSAAGRREPEA